MRKDKINKMKTFKWWFQIYRDRNYHRQRGFRPFPCLFKTKEMADKTEEGALAEDIAE